MGICRMQSSASHVCGGRGADQGSTGCRISPFALSFTCAYVLLLTPAYCRLTLLFRRSFFKYAICFERGKFRRLFSREEEVLSAVSNWLGEDLACGLPEMHESKPVARTRHPGLSTFYHTLLPLLTAEFVSAIFTGEIFLVFSSVFCPRRGGFLFVSHPM